MIILNSIHSSFSNSGMWFYICIYIHTYFFMYSF